MSKVVIAVGCLLGIVMVAGGVYWIFGARATPKEVPVVETPKGPINRVLGKSVEGRDIESYTYGSGNTHIVFVGGIHGGYEWNSVVVAYQLKRYLDANPTAVPANESVTVILNANPDAVYHATGKVGEITSADVPQGDLSEYRFNANKVDLNRNFDCKWAPTGTWQNKKVSGGTEAFSEPEAKIVRDFALNSKPSAFVMWHSAAGGVYASQCDDGILPVSLDLMNAYAQASGYEAVKEFTAYEVHGASEDWLASVGIPAITVELKTHENVEWDQNLAGSMAVIKYFATASK